MLADVLEDQLSVNATLPRTLFAILFRPGRLTAEYLQGRIASYVPPFRLYLAASVAFFLALSLGSRAEDFRAALTMDADSAAAAEARRGAGVLGAAIDSMAAAARAAEAERRATRESGGTTAESGSDTVFGITLRPQAPGDSLPWTERVVVNTGIPRLDAIVRNRIRELGGLPGDEAARRILGAILDRIPAAMFVMLPVFAALLKLLYIRRGRYYVEHFVFALHYHAFAFLAFTVMLALEGTPLQGVVRLWMGVYLWLALKRVYGQRWLRTTVKSLALSAAYFFVLVVGLVATAAVAVLLL